MYLSVIIPVYNSQDFLVECLESILNQSFSDLEIILINDGSTDKSDIICESYSKRYNNISIFNISNSGSAYARNYGLKKARGKYISFIDSDDWIHPSMFEKLTDISKDRNVDIVSCDLLNVKANGKETAERSECASGYYTREKLVKEIYPNLINSQNLTQNKWPMRMVTKIYSKNFLFNNQIGFENDLKAAQDFVFSVKAMFYANSFYYLKDEFLYNYRQNFESRTHKYLDKAWENYLSMNNYFYEILADSSEYDFSKQLELSKLHSVLSSISYVYREGNKNSFKNKYLYTKKFASYYDLSNAIKYIDWTSTDLKKKIFIYLLKNKMYLSVSLLANIYYVTVIRLHRKIIERRISREKTAFCR